jgi:hypothetical protein
MHELPDTVLQDPFNTDTCVSSECSTLGTCMLKGQYMGRQMNTSNEDFENNINRIFVSYLVFTGSVQE